MDARLHASLISSRADRSRRRCVLPAVGRSGARRRACGEHTCFEAFVRSPRRRGLFRVQLLAVRRMGGLSLSTAIATGMAELPIASIGRHSSDRRAGRLIGFELSASSSNCRRRAGHARRWPDSAFRAVIEEKDGTKSYWALAHPPGEPDFHHPDCFALDLPPAAALMKFGIDRLLADPALRAPLRASASPCSPIPPR